MKKRCLNDVKNPSSQGRNIFPCGDLQMAGVESFPCVLLDDKLHYEATVFINKRAKEKLKKIPNELSHVNIEKLWFEDRFC